MTTSPGSALAAVVGYVVGFAFDTDGRVALIRKNRPEWQAGRLNGIGGHIEATDRTPWGAMCREWCEETGQPTPANWREFVVMDFPGVRIHFFTALGLAPEWLDACRTTTDEEVCIVTVGDANQHLLIPNLTWLIPLARYTADDYDVLHVTAAMAEGDDAPLATDNPSESTPTAARTDADGLTEDERGELCICPWDGPILPEDSHSMFCSQHREAVEEMIAARIAQLQADLAAARSALGAVEALDDPACCCGQTTARLVVCPVHRVTR